MYPHRAYCRSRQRDHTAVNHEDVIAARDDSGIRLANIDKVNMEIIFCPSGNTWKHHYYNDNNDQ